MNKNYFLIFCYMVVAFTCAGEIFAQCGPDGTQPCGATVKKTLPKAPPKTKPNAPPTAKVAADVQPKEKSAAEREADESVKLAKTYYEKAWSDCPKLDDKECKISYWTKAIEANSNYVDAYDRRAFSFYSLGKFDEAVKDYNQLTIFQPKNSTNYYFLGEIAKKKAEKSKDSSTKKTFYEEAVANYSKAINLKPTEYESLRSRSESYLALEEFEKSLDDLNISTKLATKASGQPERHYYLRGLVFVRRADNRKAQSGETAETKQDYESPSMIFPDLLS